LCVIGIVVVTTGASFLSELLKVNNSLQELEMWGNDIGDEGISSVAEGLKCNKTVIKLNVGKYGLSVKGTVVYKIRVQNNLVSSCPVLIASYIWSLILYSSVNNNIVVYQL